MSQVRLLTPETYREGIRILNCATQQWNRPDYDGAFQPNFVHNGVIYSENGLSPDGGWLERFYNAIAARDSGVPASEIVKLPENPEDWMLELDLDAAYSAFMALEVLTELPTSEDTPTPPDHPVLAICDELYSVYGITERYEPPPEPEPEPETV